MPHQDKHVYWATHNNDFWQSFDLDTSDFIDWVVTGIFYEGVHWIEAFLATKGRHSRSHAERSQTMQRCLQGMDPIMNPILVDYYTLELDSRNARYECHMHTVEELKDLLPLITNIRNHISSLLS